MKKTFLLIQMIFFLMLCSHIGPEQGAIFAEFKSPYTSLFPRDGWKLILANNGFYTYKKRLPNSDFVAMRAEGIVNARIEHIVGVLRDMPRSAEWMPQLTRKIYLKEVSETKVYTYSLHSLPWPFTSRELIGVTELFFSRDKKSIVVKSHSMNIDQLPISQVAKKKLKDEGKDHVLAWMSDNQVVFRPTARDKTFLEFTIHADPKGSLPAWLVNGIQKKWPEKFLRLLEKKANEYKTMPGPKIMRHVRTVLRNNKVL